MKLKGAHKYILWLDLFFFWMILFMPYELTRTLTRNSSGILQMRMEIQQKKECLVFSDFSVFQFL